MLIELKSLAYLYKRAFYFFLIRARTLIDISLTRLYSDSGFWEQLLVWLQDWRDFEAFYY
jgi:hypothetical protein